MADSTRIRAIDSHTAGEPTRVVTGGFPDLGNGPLAERLAAFRGRYDGLRRAIVCEPRGHDAMVGALLCEPVHSGSTAAVIFFNNVGYLGMCGHGTMGLIKTLEYMGRIGIGVHQIETIAGIVEAELNLDASVTISNVASYRYAKDIEVDVNGYGNVVGDIAYGGNWFFLIGDERSNAIDLSNLEHLKDFGVAVRKALTINNITGANGAEIDHIEIFASTPNANSRNFVLCPGLEYDRSPCGTGTSAKLACLYADGKLRENEVWRQEGIVGSLFEGRVKIDGDKIVPLITGTAYVTAEIELIFDADDPYRFGLNI